jgi:tRNA (adenine57-N1/adenine58-N1)-methyltransferase catalytic subunit
MAGEMWSEGDTVSLVAPKVAPLVLRIRAGPQRVGDHGVLDLGPLVGTPVGGSLSWLGTTYRAVRPSLSDLLGNLRRGAQIVTLKDAAQLLTLTSVAPGSRVAEAGSGSGSLTTVLAWAVGPGGRVVSYERRREFLDQARANVERAGLSERVDFRERDVGRDGIEPLGFASVLLDLPEPWEVLESARAAVVPGGYVSAYTPTYNQLERAIRSMRERQLSEIRAVEILERGLHVGEGGTRPEFEMLGHTGFLAVGRRVD